MHLGIVLPFIDGFRIKTLICASEIQQIANMTNKFKWNEPQIGIIY